MVLREGAAWLLILVTVYGIFSNHFPARMERTVDRVASEKECWLMLGSSIDAAKKAASLHAEKQPGPGVGRVPLEAK